MEDFDKLIALITPRNVRRNKKLVVAIMEYINAQVLVEAVKYEIALEKSHQRRPRKHWVRQFIQRRFELGHYDNLMQELARESPDLYRNYTRMDKVSWRLELLSVAGAAFRAFLRSFLEIMAGTGLQ